MFACVPESRIKMCLCSSCNPKSKPAAFFKRITPVVAHESGAGTDHATLADRSGMSRASDRGATLLLAT